MKKALQRRIELIAGVASLKLGEEVFRDISITFTRNIPSDNSDILNAVKGLQGVVSDKTLLGMIPQVSDVDKELEAITAEKQKKMELYSFSPTNTPDDGDEE